ncbi:MAG: hypothetical protein ACRC1U_08665, partial [Vibrionaceae bacterium]
FHKSSAFERGIFYLCTFKTKSSLRMLSNSAHFRTFRKRKKLTPEASKKLRKPTVSLLKIASVR